jgi:NAD(P)-dependent dehydrogenase (short-subunit alcohol dehydrogenase family)
MASHRGFTAADVPDQSGKCFVVTGANTGIGFEITRALAERGGRVVLACRAKDKADAAIAQIKQTLPRADLAFLPCDQSDLDSIHTAVALLNKEPRIDGLINNAGVMNPPLMRTKQGFELQFGVNHLGCFSLSMLLLSKLAQTAGARIVVTSSVAHQRAQIDWDDLNAEKGYNAFQRYSASKLANALFFFELDRRLRATGSPVIAVGCHPGMAATDLGRYMGALQVLNPLVSVILNSAAKGAWPALQAATGNITAGGYYGPVGFGGVRGASAEASRAPQATNPVLAQRLWDVSVSMTGLHNETL